MKKYTITLILLLFAFNLHVFGQDIRPSEVPTVIMTTFQKEHPKAYDVEWELDGINYKVEFHTGLMGNEYKIWYDPKGNIIRQKQEISHTDLPKDVIKAIHTNYPTSKGYRIDDVDKITEGREVVYVVEVEGPIKWKIMYDVYGKEISKRVD